MTAVKAGPTWRSVTAAAGAGVPVRQVSFKGALQAARNWEPLLSPSRQNLRDRKRMLAEFYEAVGRTLIEVRPGRSEPRCVKRRPKSFQYMTAPREVMKETPHRGKRTAKGCLNQRHSTLTFAVGGIVENT